MKAMRMKWLHLSDIHFNYPNYDSKILRKDFLNRVHSLGETERFTHLFLSGDILYKNSNEADDASDSIKFIRDLINEMNLDNNHVIIVPGNHDHDRSITKEHTRDIYLENENRDEKIEQLSTSEIEALLKAFSRFDDVYKGLFSEKYYESYANPHKIIELDTATIICLNTAWLDVDSKDTSILRCGRKQLNNLLESHYDRLTQTINIAIGHHPIGDFSKEEQKHILSLFHRYNIGLYFCGHKHKSEVHYFQDKDVLQIICPGGFYDGYSLGGYVYGIVDTDSHFYKAEFYKWNNDDWYIESDLDGTDEKGVLYFNTQKYKHNNQIAAVDLRVLGPHIPMRELIRAIGSDNIDCVVYPYSNLKTESIDWDKQYVQIKGIAEKTRNLIDQGNTVHLFPLAPIPMLIALGFELQNNCRIIIHQYDRVLAQWVTSEKDEGIDCKINLKTNGNDALVVKISCSGIVQDNMINEALPGLEYDQLDIESTSPKLGMPLFCKDVLRIVKKTFDELNKIVISNNYSFIHVFAAVPAGMAVEIGRNMMQTLFDNIVTYQLEKKRYAPALVINPNEREISKPATQANNVIYINEYKDSIAFVPILGNIACGSISEAIQEAGEYYPISFSMVGKGDYFIVKAVGDSMINAGIDNGDLVLVRCQQSADDGQIVVALVDDCTTLKRLYHDDKNRRIILKADNPDYEDQVFEDINIQGVAVQVIKSLV